MKKARKTATAEQKAWLKENGYTEKMMDEFWKDNIDTNLIIRKLNEAGMSWRDMNLSCVKQLPTQKEKDAASKRLKEIELKNELDAAAKAKADKDYYYEHFEEIMVDKIDKKEDLTEKELSEIRDYSIEDHEGDEGRWVRHMTSILKMCGRFFELSWSRGLTEYQENEFYNQPYEVEKKAYQKTITVTEWIRKA